MAQQTATIWGLGVDDDMGDLEYIEKKAIAGDTFYVSGDINGMGDKISHIVPDGKRAFLLEAKIMNPTHPSGAGFATQNTINQKNLVTAALKLDGAIKDKAVIGEATTSANGSNQYGGGSGNGYGDLGDGKFNVKTLNLLGVGITKKIEIENIVDNGNAFATMSGYYA